MAALRIVDLGTLGGDSSEATAINRYNSVVGYSETTNGEWHAFRKRRSDPRMLDLNPPQGDHYEYMAVANDISDTGYVVGMHYDEGGFVWQRGEYRYGLWGGLGYDGGNIFAVNDSGVVVGYGDTDVVPSGMPLRWAPGSSHSEGFLPSPGSGEWGGRAYDVNDAGQIVGSASVVDLGDYTSGPVRAFVWEPGKHTILGTLGGTSSQAYAINDHGTVVGVSRLRDGQPRGFVWRPGQRMKALPTLGGRGSTAYGINNNGVIVGTSKTKRGKVHAVRWHRGTITDLGTLAGRGGTSYAADVNDAGFIVGWSTTPDGHRHATLWRP